MNSGSSSRVSIPNNLRETFQSIREMAGKEHSDDDIYAVYKDSLNDPFETAQKLRFLDTFHEVRSKREKKKENVVPVTHGSNRNGGRNFASQGYGRSAFFKRENGDNHVTGGFRPSRPAPNRGRNFAAPRANKVSGPSGVGNQNVQVDCIAAVDNKGLAEELPPSKAESVTENGVEPEKSKAISEPVAAAPVSVSQNSQPAKMQPLTFGRQDASRSVDQVTENGTASSEVKAQSLPKSEVGERSHVTFPFHIQATQVLQNGLTFGSFDSNFVKEVSSNNDASGGEESIFESSHESGNDEEDSSSVTDVIPGVASAREGASPLSDGKDHEISQSAPEDEQLVVHTDQIIQPGQQAFSNTEIPQIVYGQGAPLSMFGLVPSLPALGQPVITEAAETQPGNSNASAISLASYPPDHLFRQQYHPSFYPYSPYYQPFYMPSPYLHQFLNSNGFPQQSYYPPGAALAAPSPIQPIGSTESPPTTNPSPQGTHIPSANVSDSVRSEGQTSPLTESAAPWIGQGLGNLQMSSMYNHLALQSQLLNFQAMQAGHGGLMGIPHPTQPMAAATTSYQTLPPPPFTTTAMAEPTEHPRIAYQQPQAAQTNWVNNY